MELRKYQEAYEKLKRDRQGDPSWLLRLREEAMTSFVQKGFPTTKDDSWRYTDVTAIREALLDLHEAIPELSRETVEALKRKSGRNFLLVVNGKFLREHSSVEEGVDVTDLAEAVVSRSDLLEPHLGRYVVPGSDAFSALSIGLFKQGLFIRIPENLIVKEPIHMVFFTNSSRGRSLFQIRNLIMIGEKSKAAIAETYAAEDGKKYFTNVVTEIVLEEGAQMEHCKIQQEHPEAFHVAVTQVVQHRGSSFVSFVLSTGARLMRDDCRVALAAEGASCELNGLYLGDKDQVLDHQTFVDHQKPDGKSDQFFKGLLAGSSRGVFRGHVMVRQDAQRTDAHQTNKNLLLSDTAKVDTQPQLEILADEVNCGHGAAVGQLQEDALFYLRSRGIGEKEAGRMLAQGFAREVIDRSSLSFMKETLSELVSEKLMQQL
ncbi:MAG: Fe-S cluster assembly protein SufD, partial [Candidatus Omnitrophota bacterium]